MADLETLLSRLLTIRQVAEMFDRTEQTVNLWRRKHGMPFICIPGNRKGAIRFEPEKVLRWAKEHHKRLAL